MAAKLVGTLGRSLPVKVGDHVAWTKTFTAADVQAFADVSADHNPVHLDPEFAKTTPFKKCIAHGMLVGAMFSTMFATAVPGTIYLDQILRFKAPVFVGDEVTARIEVLRVAKGRIASCSTVVENNTTGKVAIEGDAAVMVKLRE